MVSKNLKPNSNVPEVHNVPDDILDHHPLSMKFNIQCGFDTNQNEVQTLKQIPDMRFLEKKVEETHKAFDDNYEVSTKFPHQTSTHSNVKVNQESQQLPFQSQHGAFQNQHQSQSSGLVGFSIPPLTIGNNNNVLLQKVHSHQLHSSSDVRSIQEQSSSEGTRSQRSVQNVVENPEKIQFKCEICDSLFSTRLGLFIHFGKSKDPHFPCKEKFQDELDPNKNQCLRVFSSAANCKQHKTKQEMHGNRRHHNPKQNFPNLVVN